MLFLQCMPRNDPFHPPKPILIVVKMMSYFLQGRSIRLFRGGGGTPVPRNRVWDRVSFFFFSVYLVWSLDRVA